MLCPGGRLSSPATLGAAPPKPTPETDSLNPGDAPTPLNRTLVVSSCFPLLLSGDCRRRNPPSSAPLASIPLAATLPGIPLTSPWLSLGRRPPLSLLRHVARFAAAALSRAPRLATSAVPPQPSAFLHSLIPGTATIPEPSRTSPAHRRGRPPRQSRPCRATYPTAARPPSRLLSHIRAGGWNLLDPLSLPVPGAHSGSSPFAGFRRRAPRSQSRFPRAVFACARPRGRRPLQAARASRVADRPVAAAVSACVVLPLGPAACRKLCSACPSRSTRVHPNPRGRALPLPPPFSQTERGKSPFPPSSLPFSPPGQWRPVSTPWSLVLGGRAADAAAAARCPHLDRSTLPARARFSVSAARSTVLHRPTHPHRRRFRTAQETATAASQALDHQGRFSPPKPTSPPPIKPKPPQTPSSLIFTRLTPTAPLPPNHRRRLVAARPALVVAVRRRAPEEPVRA